MSLKSMGAVATLVALVGAMCLLPTVADAGGYYRHRYYYGPRYYPRPHYHRGNSVRLWIGLGFPVFPGFYAPYPPYVYRRPPTVIVTPGDTPVQQQYCREFQRDIIIDGKPVQAYGTACLQPDGSWKIVP